MCEWVYSLQALRLICPYLVSCGKRMDGHFKETASLWWSLTGCCWFSNATHTALLVGYVYPSCQLQYELRVVALPLLRAFRRCRNLSPHEVLLSAHPRFALAFSMHWAVTGSIHAECQRAEVWPHLCPYLVWDVPLWSAYGCVAATGRPDISYFTGGAEQEQRKDHFANTALRAKTEKHGWRNLVGES